MRSGAPEAREQVQWTCESDERRELGRAAVPSPAHVRKTVGGRGWSGLEFKLSIVSPEFLSPEFRSRPIGEDGHQPHSSTMTKSIAEF